MPESVPDAYGVNDNSVDFHDRKNNSSSKGVEAGREYPFQNQDDARQERDRKILERKLRALNNADSIFILPFGREGFMMATMVRGADKLVATVKRRFGISLDVNEAREIFRELEEFAATLWRFVYTVSPNLHTIKARDWRRMNDSVDVKKTISYRRASIVIEPRSEECAMIAMAVKIIQIKNIELRQCASFEDLEAFVKEYVKLLSSFDLLLENVSSKLGVEYRPYLKEANL